jgi:hypothetical protein
MIWLDSRGKIQNSQLEPFIFPESIGIINAWRESFTYLQYLDNDIRQDGLELIIMTVPLKLEIDDKYRKQILASNKIPDSQFDVERPLNQIKKFCEMNAISLLDPRDELQKKHKEKPCYFIYDGHWVTEGIRTASESAARQLSQLQILPFLPSNSKR